MSVEQTLKDRATTHGDFSDHSKTSQELKRVAFAGCKDLRM